jgi:kinetochore protein Mis13/DSN1
VSQLTTAAAVFDETDGDFHFTRGSKRAKTGPSEPEPPAPAPVKKSTGRVAKQAKTRTSPPPPAASDLQAPAVTGARRSSRRISGQNAPAPPPAAPQPRAQEMVVPKTRGTRRKTREKLHEDETANEAPAQKEKPAPTARSSTPTEAERGRRRTKQPTQNPQPAAETNEAPVEESTDLRQIFLPLSDTPIIDRNKELRKKGGARRSSLGGSRGRRASSLIDNGHSAMPHREVEPAEFYKHIEADGPSEPRRMRQLLTWCGKRALSEKPPHGSHGSSAVLGGTFLDSLT